MSVRRRTGNSPLTLTADPGERVRCWPVYGRQIAAPVPDAGRSRPAPLPIPLARRIAGPLLAACLLFFGSAAKSASSAGAPHGDGLDRILSKVVKIFGAGGIRNLEAYGSGLLVSADGHVVTVWSHLLDSGDVTIVLNDGRKFNAKFLKGDLNLDLAVLKIESDEHDFPFFDLRQSADAPPGTRVLGFSNMFKVATGDEPVSVVHGVIAVRTRLAARRGAFQSPYAGPVYIVDAVTNNPGASGGALTTLDGRLIGMIGRELLNLQTNTYVNYAVPIAELRRPIEEMIAGRFKPTESKPADNAAPRYLPLDLGLVMVPDVVYRTPAYVDSVVGESAAAQAGLQPQDLIVFVNDDLVQSCRALKSIVGRFEPGDKVRLVVRRRERLVPLELQVPSRRGK